MCRCKRLYVTVKYLQALGESFGRFPVNSQIFSMSVRLESLFTAVGSHHRNIQVPGQLLREVTFVVLPVLLQDDESSIKKVRVYGNDGALFLNRRLQVVFP